MRAAACLLSLFPPIVEHALRKHTPDSRVPLIHGAAPGPPPGIRHVQRLRWIDGRAFPGLFWCARAGSCGTMGNAFGKSVGFGSFIEVRFFGLEVFRGVDLRGKRGPKLWSRTILFFKLEC